MSDKLLTPLTEHLQAFRNNSYNSSFSHLLENQHPHWYNHGHFYIIGKVSHFNAAEKFYIYGETSKNNKLSATKNQQIARNREEKFTLIHLSRNIQKKKRHTHTHAHTTLPFNRNWYSYKWDLTTQCVFLVILDMCIICRWSRWAEKCCNSPMC